MKFIIDDENRNSHYAYAISSTLILVDNRIFVFIPQDSSRCKDCDFRNFKSCNGVPCFGDEGIVGGGGVYIELKQEQIVNRAIFEFLTIKEESC